ncbi:hypothetical protein EDB83DRAFT_2533719 [Lactarius deliciosus]|nr:hypothetical protein EDB83DRAFT_2533719 [Lactarius deliciosus]
MTLRDSGIPSQKSSTPLHVRNTYIEDPRLLAGPAYQRRVWGDPTFDPPTPEDEDNMVAALKHSDRVCSISLTISTSLLAKLFAVDRPFLKLEELVLRSLDNVQLTLPSALRWGTRLRSLHSTRIVFPALPQLLSSSENLVDLWLHKIPSSGYLSPKVFVNALSGITQLQYLLLHFLSPAS